MKRISILLIAVLLIAACSNKKTFSVGGVIEGASDKTLYLEASNLQGLMLLDSVRINSKGHYSFKSESQLSPEFYRLRLEDKAISFSIDSVEAITINSSYDKFGIDYTVEGSKNSQKIKEILALQYELQNQTNKLLEDAHFGRINNKVLQESLVKLYNEYKDNIKRNYILTEPNTTSAYFALFLKVNDYMLFDPLNNKDDLRSFAAVATSFNEKYPHSDRAKGLYKIVIKGMRNTRQPKDSELLIPEDKISYTGIIDIDLRDITGNSRKLSDLKGKVVLLDFNVYQSPVSAAHVFALRDLYDKYASKGLEIYQVSLDADEHFWKLAVDNLPWVCVRDERGIYSNYAAMYNLKQFPAYFLINRNSELSVRGDQVKDIDKAIKELL